MVGNGGGATTAEAGAGLADSAPESAYMFKHVRREESARANESKS